MPNFILKNETMISLSSGMNTLKRMQKDYEIEKKEKELNELLGSGILASASSISES